MKNVNLANTHVPDKVYAYSLQVRHMMYELLDCKDGDAVSVEVFDDIGVEKSDGTKEAIQAKSVLSNRNPVGYAVVLYTPCDLGKAKDDSDLKKRARQNVIFEHGYLIGKLGRERVSALVKGDIEKPNDISGVVYIDMDNGGGWKVSLAREMKSIGYEIDMNKIS